MRRIHKTLLLPPVSHCTGAQENPDHSMRNLLLGRVRPRQHHLWFGTNESWRLAAAHCARQLHHQLQDRPPTAEDPLVAAKVALATVAVKAAVAVVATAAAPASASQAQIVAAAEVTHP